MICKKCHSELTEVEASDSCTVCHAFGLCMMCMDDHYCQKPITVGELIEKISSFPHDSEIWSFDYGDDQAYMPSSVEMLQQSEFVAHPHIMIR